jgi:hypothetical protein
MAVYEVQDEATYRRLVDSDHMKHLRAEYDANFPTSERARSAYVQVWPYGDGAAARRTRSACPSPSDR